MKRRAIKVMLFLLLGAIINVAVAWVAALCIRYDEPPVAYIGAQKPTGHFSVILVHEELASTFVGEGLRYDLLIDLGVARRRPGWHAPSWSLVAHERLGGLEAFEEARGWPMRCVRWILVLENEASDVQWGIDCGGAARRLAWTYKTDDAPRSQRVFLGAIPSERILPYQPIWPGFAINTLFYAATLWVLFAFPGVARRTIRRRRGRCITCGYDLRGAAHDVCPECGKPLPKQKAETQKAGIA